MGFRLQRDRYRYPAVAPTLGVEMIPVLVACIALGIPVRECRVDVMGCKTRICETPLPPTWATDGWVNFAAGIVAGEAPRNCPECREWIACTLVRDVERGWHPWDLRARWFGWGYAREADKQAVRDALVDCEEVPVCRFLGNVKDYQYTWSHLGDALVTGNRNGLVVCVPFEN